MPRCDAGARRYLTRVSIPYYRALMPRAPNAHTMISLRLPISELKAIDAKAREAGLTRSEFLRRALSSIEIVTRAA